MNKFILLVIVFITFNSFGQYDLKAYEEAIKSIKKSEIFVTYCQEAEITNQFKVSIKTFSSCDSFTESEIQKKVWDYCLENNITDKDQKHRELKKLSEKQNSPLLIRFSEICAGYFIGIVSTENSRAFLRYVFKFENGILELSNGNLWITLH